MSMEMRMAFGQALSLLMDEDPRILIVDADLSTPDGTSPLKEKYSDRMFNVGVQEANMASFSAGLASYGFIPVITTFAAFASRRIFDQVAISIAYAKSNVKIVGTDPGITAELNGGTHMSFEDAGLMRSLPGMVVFEPCDANQLQKALPQLISHDGPVYIRMSRKICPDIFSSDYVFSFGKGEMLKSGSDVSLFTSGIEVKPALEAAEILFSKGIDAEVINIHTWKPIDRETIIESVRKTGCAVTCENHNIINGLGSAVAEVAAESYPIPIMRVGARDRFGEVGKMDYLTKALQLSAEDIAKKAKEAIVMKHNALA